MTSDDWAYLRPLALMKVNAGAQAAVAPAIKLDHPASPDQPHMTRLGQRFDDGPDGEETERHD
jgi:hypothetical protein